MFLQSRRECRTQWSQRSRPVVLKWLKITYCDGKTNIRMKEKTKVKDVILQVRIHKRSWVGQVSRIQDDRWIAFITGWRLYEQTICNFYKFNDDEQYATVGVLRDLINCRDGLYDIHYFNCDDITAIIDELCTN